MLAVCLAGLLALGGGVARATSTDATLSNLAVSAGSLSPAFDGTPGGYELDLPDGTTSIDVTPTTTDPGATYTVSWWDNNTGETLVATSGTAHVPVTPESEAIVVDVTAGDGTTTLEYQINVSVGNDATLSSLAVNHGSFTQSFDPQTDIYDLNLPVDTTSLRITPTLDDPAATFTVSYDNTSTPVGGQSATVSGGSATIPLEPNNNQSVTVTVTAADGTTQMQYAVNISVVASTVATLSGLTVSTGTLSPAFAGGTTSYTVDVPNGVSSIDLTALGAHANQTFQLDQRDGSGTFWMVDSGQTKTLQLVPGENDFDVLVTAEDQSTFEYYYVTVDRGYPAADPQPAPAAAPAPDTTAPSEPEISGTSVADTSATLSWQLAFDNVGVTGYAVSLNGGKVSATTSGSYLFTGLTCGTTYTLAVAAVDAAGNVSVVASAVATTTACPAPPTTPAPPAKKPTPKKGKSETPKATKPAKSQPTSSKPSASKPSTSKRHTVTPATPSAPKKTTPKGSKPATSKPTSPATKNTTRAGQPKHKTGSGK